MLIRKIAGLGRDLILGCLLLAALCAGGSVVKAEMDGVSPALQWYVNGLIDYALGEVNLEIDFGALCDGRTDNSVAIQNWLNANTRYKGTKTLRAAGGSKCNHYQPVIYNADLPLHIVCGGNYQTTFVYTNATPGTGWLLEGSGGAGSQNNTTIEGCNWGVPSATASPSISLEIKNRYGPILKNVMFGQKSPTVTSAYTELYLVQAFAPRIEDSFFWTAGCYAFTTAVDYSANALVFTGNVITNGGFVGLCPTIYIPNGGGIFIAGNDVEGAYGDWQFSNILGMSFVGNHTEQQASAGSPDGMLLFTATNGRSSNITMSGNYWGAGGTNGNTIGDIDNLTWHDDYFANYQVAWGTGSDVLTNAYIYNITLVGTSSLGAFVSVGSCNGIGSSGTCTISGNNQQGRVTLTPGGSSIGSAGNFTISFNLHAASQLICNYTLANGGGGWAGGANAFGASSGSSSSVAPGWNNAGIALTSGQTFNVDYICRQQ